MFGTIVITFVITVLSMSALFLHDRCRQKDRESQQLKRANDNLNKHVSDYRITDQARREQNAYDRGLYDGRKTDTLYRSMLSKYSKGEQITVMAMSSVRRTMSNGTEG